MSDTVSATTSHSRGLLALLGQVLDPKTEPTPMSPELQHFTRQQEKFEGVLGRISVASANLQHKCIILAHRLKEIHAQRDAMERAGSRLPAFSLQVISSYPRRIPRNNPFSLTFRVIDRQGEAVVLSSHEIFSLRVLEAKEGGKGRRSTYRGFIHVLAGQILATPMQNGEISFPLLSFTRSSNHSPSGKFTLEVFSVSNPAVNALAIDPILVKYVQKVARLGPRRCRKPKKVQELE